MTGQLIERLIEAVARPGEPASARRPVTEEELAALLGAARVAPSADNLQTWRFVVVRSADSRVQLADAVPATLADTVRTASVVVAVCGVRAIVKALRREQPFVLIDVPIALSHILLQAAELSVPCAWTLELDEISCRRTLGIPEDVRVVALVGLG